MSINRYMVKEHVFYMRTGMEFLKLCMYLHVCGWVREQVLQCICGDERTDPVFPSTR